MLIKYISIINADKEFNVNANYNGAYVIKASLAFTPRDVWKKQFLIEWRKHLHSEERKARFSGNDLNILLATQDDIQQYIEMVKSSIHCTNKALEQQRVKKGLNYYEGEALKSNRHYKVKKWS